MRQHRVLIYLYTLTCFAFNSVCISLALQEVAASTLVKLPEWERPFFNELLSIWAQNYDQTIHQIAFIILLLSVNPTRIVNKIGFTG